ncbi:MAG: GntP family permease [Pirellulales bacterium]
MGILLILCVGVAVVIGGILLFRLHAFLVLILAALIVSALTPADSVRRYALNQAKIKFDSSRSDTEEICLKAKPTDVPLGTQLLVVLGGTDETVAITVVRFEQVEARSLAVATGYGSRPWFDDNVVVSPKDVLAADKLAQTTIGERVATSFGATCGKIGILIAMAAIIGKCLLDSGAADKIVRSALKLFGERGAPGAFVSSGFLLGIPVFFDTVFYLMVPLGKALRVRTGRNYLLYVLTIVCGATMAHSLVPPTPGPLFVAESLGVDLGLMILCGCVVGLFASTTGYIYAQFMNSRFELPLRESEDLSLADLDNLVQHDESALPPLWISLAPILLPIILIAGYTILKNYNGHFSPTLMYAAKTLGNKNIALVISAAIALITLVRQKKTDRKALAASIHSALASGGVIILITAGGGAFGRAMQQTGVASLIQDLPQGSMLLTLLLAFLVTTAIRTAQGSATVAMITAVGILAGVASAEQLGFHPVYVALAIGCGSKPLAWMNDSGFWVICKMSGMTETEGLKYITPMSAAMGVVGLTVTILGAWLFPMTG